MTGTNTCYAIVQVDSNGNPVSYLPFLGSSGWQPTMPYTLTTDRSTAWRFFDRQTAEETLDVMKVNPATPDSLRVIEIDCDGPPLNLPTPPTLQ